MPFTCAVAECENSEAVKKLRGKTLIYHRFPKDPNTFKSWVSKCKRGDKRPPDFSKARICCDHFTEHDNDRDFKSELLGIPAKRRLKACAIPSIFPARNLDLSAPDRHIRQQKQDGKKMVKNILNDSSNKENCGPTLSYDTEMPSCGDDNPSFIVETVHQKPSLLEEGCKSNPEGSDEAANLYDKIKMQEKRILELQKENDTLRYHNKKLIIVDSKLGKFFSKSQRQLIMGNKRVNWSTSDIVKALSIQSISPKCYTMLKKTFSLHLPSPRTLRSWTYRFVCDEAILEEVMVLLQQETDKMNSFWRQCILSFDEVSLNSQHVLDPRFQCIISKSKAQVMMMRGLFGTWRQPIYYAFNTKMTVDLLFSILRRVEQAKFEVCGIVCDLGVDNQALLKALNISTENTSFENPAENSRSIFVFLDIPHCLKNLRNHVIYVGVILQNGTLIDKKILHKMADNNGHTDLKLCPHFSRESLQITGAQRMRVRPACQFFSNRMSCLAKKSFPDTLEIARFFQVINDGFDVMNSRIPIDHKNKLKSAYGAYNIFRQDEILNELKTWLLSMRFRTKQGNPRRTLLPCQMGFIISIISLQSLFQQLRKNISFEYILTCRLNQDCLERFFSRIRSFGGPNSHPNATEFRYRLKLVLLGSNSKLVQVKPRGSNVEDYDDENYLSAGLLKPSKSLQPDEELDDLYGYEEPSLPPEKRRTRKCGLTEIESESLHYLAGYIAWKLGRKGNLKYGKITSDPSIDPFSISKTWLGMLSRGGLVVPNDDFHRTIITCEEEFKRVFDCFHSRKYCAMKLFFHMRRKFPNIDESILKAFIRVRMRIRTNFLNHLRASKSEMNTRKKLQFVKSR